MKQQYLSQGDISAILKSKFDITPPVQVLRDKETGIVRYEIEHVPVSRKMSIGGLKRYCKRICDALDADIGGTINIEFISLGDEWTFDILADARQRSNNKEIQSGTEPAWKRRRREMSAFAPIVHDHVVYLKSSCAIHGLCCLPSSNMREDEVCLPAHTRFSSAIASRFRQLTMKGLS